MRERIVRVSPSPDTEKWANSLPAALHWGCVRRRTCSGCTWQRQRTVGVLPLGGQPDALLCDGASPQRPPSPQVSPLQPPPLPPNHKNLPDLEPLDARADGEVELGAGELHFQPDDEVHSLPHEPRRVHDVERTVHGVRGIHVLVPIPAWRAYERLMHVRTPSETQTLAHPVSCCASSSKAGCEIGLSSLASRELGFSSSGRGNCLGVRFTTRRLRLMRSNRSSAEALQSAEQAARYISLRRGCSVTTAATIWIQQGVLSAWEM